MPTPHALLAPADLARAQAINAAKVFAPWQKEYAAWYAFHRHTPNAEKLAKLKELTGWEWTLSRWRILHENTIFRAYVRALRERPLEEAKKKMGELSYKAVVYTEWAMDAAHQEGDYEAMPKITAQVFERTMPRREDLGTPQQTVVVVLTDKQKAIEEAPPIEVTWEEVK